MNTKTITILLIFLSLFQGENVWSEKIISAVPVPPVNLNTDAFSQNELVLESATGRSGYSVTVRIFINNTDSFTGFQFEINLPEQIRFVPGSAQLSERKTDHQISADTVQNKLIVTAWSPTNASFTNHNGEIATLDFYLEGNGGNYYLNLTNPIIADAKATNILSTSYSNYIGIIAPSISLSTASHDFGRVSVTGSSEYTFTIHNYGDDTLKIQSIASTQSSFTVSDENCPIYISPNQNKNISVTFENLAEGTYSGRLIIRNNDVNNDPAYLNLQGETFEPNELQVVNGTGVRGELNYLEINMENYTGISAFQFDLELPEGFTVISDSCVLTGRSDGHSLAISNLFDNSVRFISYSGSLKTYSGNSGTVLKIGLMTEQDTPPGSYDIHLQNVILSDAGSRNVVSEVSGGHFELFDNGIFETETVTICEGETYLGWDVTGTYTRTFSSESEEDSIVITHLTVHPSYSPDVIVEGNSLITDNHFVTYQWYNDAGPVYGATNNQLDITKSGNYYVEVTDENGCTNTSEVMNMIYSNISPFPFNEFRYSILPNPNSGQFVFRFDSQPLGETLLKLIDPKGQVLETRIVRFSVENDVERFNVNHLSKGIYFLIISNASQQVVEKIVVN